MLELFKRMWLRQNAFVRRVIAAQNALLMGIAYVTGIGPVALAFRALGRSAVVRLPPDPSAATYWEPRRAAQPTMRSATRRW